MATTLTLTSLWVAPVSTLSDTMTLLVSAESEQVESPAEIRRYAGGRDRVVVTPGGSTTLTFAARNVTRTTHLELLSRVGELQIIRDQRGRAMAGIIQSVNADEWVWPESPVGDVSFSVTSVTWSEIV